LESDIQQLDPTLMDAARRASSKMHYQVERLGRRVANAHARKQRQASSDAALLSAALYPGGALQERGLGGVYFLAKYGDTLLDGMHDSLQTSCPHHQILFL
jgi:bacillithiol synthase